MAAEIEGKERTLKDVFGGDYAFRIPPYQRPYRWGTGHTDDLLEDLLLAAGSLQDDPVDDMNPYFLGSVVLVKKKHDADAEVLDGQQRLTTLTLLIACLRDLSQTPQFKAGLTTYLYDPGNPVEGTSDHYRLRVRDDDQAYFEANVLKPDGLMHVGLYSALSRRNIRRLREELRVNTTCGASNVSFGLPNRQVVTGTFLAMAIGAGMTSAIMSPLHPEVLNAVRAADVLAGQDQDCMAWIRANRDPNAEGSEGRGRREGRRRRPAE